MGSISVEDGTTENTFSTLSITKNEVPASVTNKFKLGCKTATVSAETPITEAEVVEYLKYHPVFLKEYIVKNVDQKTMNRWIGKRGEFSSRNSTRKLIKCGAKLANTITPEIMKEITKPSALGGIADTLDSDNKSIRNTVFAESEALAITQLFRESILQSTHAEGGYIYMANSDNGTLSLLDPAREEEKKYVKMVYRITDETVPASIAASKQKIVVFDHKDKFIHFYQKRLPKGCHCVMAIPLTREDGSLVSVVELYRFSNIDNFLPEDADYAETYARWARTTLTFSSMYTQSIERQRVHNFILQVAQNLFSKITAIDEVMLDIVSYAKALVRADRGALFLLNETKTHLETRILDAADGTKMLVIPNRKKNIFSVDEGILGFVAKSGKLENLIDVQADPRFEAQVDSRPNYEAYSMLCVPVKVKDDIIGVMQMINSSHGQFTTDNEEYFTTFAVYCGLALHVAGMYEANIKSQQQCKATLEVMSLHTQCTEQEVKALKKQPLPRHIPKIASFNYSPWSVPQEQKIVHVIFMFQDLFSATTCSGLERLRATWLRFDIKTVLRFVLTVRKNYRVVPYHNWDHAIAVNQAAYVILKRCCKSRFAVEEELAMFIGALCHDIDHRGKSNQFMINNQSPLAALYATSTMEQHHFNLTVTILQRDGHNIFQMLSTHRYRIILDLIKHCILSTDLGMYCTKTGSEITARLEEGDLDFTSRNDRTLLISTCMTACDLCAMYKPWNIQFIVVLIIMKEFWLEGDEEKRNGRTPMPMMDRDNRHLLPECQVDFINNVCLPCFTNVSRVFPEYAFAVKSVTNNFRRWQILKEMDEYERLKKLAEMELKIVDLKQNLVTAEKHTTRQSLYFAKFTDSSSDRNMDSESFSSESL